MRVNKLHKSDFILQRIVKICIFIRLSFLRESAPLLLDSPSSAHLRTKLGPPYVVRGFAEVVHSPSHHLDIQHGPRKLWRNKINLK